MDEKTLEALATAGWTDSRAVDVVADLKALKEDGYQTWPELSSQLANIANLTVKAAKGRHDVTFDIKKAVAYVDPSWATRYSIVLQTLLVPVGNSSHATIYLSQDGKFYGGFDNLYGYLGGTLAEAIQSLFGDEPPIDKTLDSEE